MPEYIHDDRQALLLDEYRLLLLGDPAAPAPAELDPNLAAIARTLEQRLGGPRPDPAVAPRPAFTATLRQQLQQQAAERTTTVAPGTLAPTTALNGRPAAAPRQSVRRAWRHGQPVPAPAPRAGQAGPSGVTGEPLADRLPAPVSSRRQAVWATTRTFAGWVSAAALILVIALLTALLLRDTHTSLGTRPTVTPAPTTTPRPASLPAVPPALVPPGTSVLPEANWTDTTDSYLFFRGRGYQLAGQTPGSDVSWHAGGTIGQTVLRWQTGGVFPAGTTVSSVIGQPPEQLLAIQYGEHGERTAFYKADDQTTALFASIQVVIGTVTSQGQPLCAWTGCDRPPPGQRLYGSISTPAAITVEQVLHGGLPANSSQIEIRQLGAADEPLPNNRPVPLTPGQRVLMFLQPAQTESIADFSAGDYYWTGKHWLYGITGDDVTPLGANTAGDAPVPLGQFSAAIATVYQGVLPRDPRATPAATPNRSVPTATAPVPTAPIPTTAPTVVLSSNGAWTAAGTMAMPHAQHTATRLADGRVLVAGGNSNGGDITAAAELYDPRTGKWTLTGAMNVPRAEQIALLLGDGQVLVFGGFNYEQYHNTTQAAGAERYNPATGRWLLTAPPPIELSPFVMTLLADGRVLIIGGPPVGAGPGPHPLQALIYDPEADVWTRAGSPDLANAGAAIMLYDGQVLVIGEAGQDNNGTTPTVLYDPATNTWSAGVPLPEARSGYTATRLPNRLVLVAGGVTFQQDGHGGTSARPLASTFVFDPIANAWSAEKAMNVARTGTVAVSLTDGRVLVIGGDDPAGGNQGITTEVYDPSTGRWSLAGRLSPVRARFAAAALADGGALITGGDSGFVQSHWLDTTERFTPGVAAPRTLFVEPANGSCATLNAIIVRGSGFTPGVLTRYTLRRDRDGQITGGNSQAGGQQITAEGAYFSTIPLDGCGPDEPIGSTFTVTVSEYYPDRTPTKGPEASATFTVSARTLSLAPASGPCTTQAVLQGAGFPAS
ncbi:MAG: kelch repeat-containing protein [Thermomicrobiales bacterium]